MYGKMGQTAKSSNPQLAIAQAQAQNQIFLNTEAVHIKKSKKLTI